MATAQQLDQFLDSAFERALSRVMRGSSKAPTKDQVKEIAREAIKVARQKIVLQIEDQIDGKMRVFEDGLVTRLNEWGNAVKMVNGDDIIFPEGTKFASCDGQSASFIVEQKPQLRTIINQSHGSRAKNARLAFPYMIFGFHFNKGAGLVDMTACARNKPLLSMDDELFHLTISNIYKGRFKIGVCRNYQIDDVKQPIHLRVADFIANFWQSGFFNANSHAGASARDQRIKSFDDWKAATEDDPKFILEINWPKVSGTMTPRKLIESWQKDTRSSDGQTKNVFRPVGRRLSDNLRDVVLNTVDPEEHKKPKEEKEKKVEVDMAKAKAIQDDDIKNPMFAANVAKPKLKRGQKRCPTCNRIYGVRQRMCICGWNFETKTQTGEEKRAEAQQAIQRLLKRKDNVRPEARAVPRPRPAPKPKQVAVEKVVRQAKAKKVKPKNPKKPPAELGKGKKYCPTCYVVVGSRTRACHHCGHEFY